ncbi:hypothetical protein PHYSODRAFT_251580 [Phytophthora sojae]|uniref:Uncharacterized protein n=1 Tax=Phytophthora sojae (strain P6497) TaxID=1094619 RepID=G4YMK1_PHYSP|nr:hypothetical protein PHYSODRAFT_251580 [Phytophthora sojae]EGZ28876.1 hypothetical protein PHYSODRAFT_251580 [Phytophthora sojae]|eukprot:XP_009516151.1 hypothetical protein PHYSODRAFT_251580 [Phytophthora sojae]
MARHVWFKIPDRPVQFAPMTDGVDSIGDLRERVVFEFFTRKVQDQVKFYASPAAQHAKQPLDLDTKVDGLGVDLLHPVLVEAPLMFPRIRVVMHGVRLEAPRLERKKLLDQVATSLLADQKRFVLLAAPEGSGKTSIVMLFEHHHADLNCVFVSFIWERGPVNEVMQQHGLDICGRKSALSEDQQHVILIDDAQEKYEDRAFWKALITDSSNIRFVIAANHALHGESPIEFRSIKTFWRPDFLLSDEESYGFLALSWFVSVEG